MAYEKPKCDCGEDLVFQINAQVEMEYSIKKNGHLSKRRREITSPFEEGWGWLHCPGCGNDYEYNYSFHGKEAFKFKREKLL